MSPNGNAAIFDFRAKVGWLGWETRRPNPRRYVWGQTQQTFDWYPVLPNPPICGEQSRGVIDVAHVTHWVCHMYPQRRVPLNKLLGCNK